MDLVEQSEKVSFYSISFAMDRTTEYERFLEKFEQESSYNEDYQRILYACPSYWTGAPWNGILGLREK